MKLVIDISKQDYELACKHPEVLFGVYAKCIKNGTPLPKGHGRIVDESQITSVEYHEERETIHNVFGSVFERIHIIIDSTDAPTIIEADRREENE